MSTFTNPLKQRFTETEPLFGLWLSLGSDGRGRSARARRFRLAADRHGALAER